MLRRPLAAASGTGGCGPTAEGRAEGAWGAPQEGARSRQGLTSWLCPAKWRERGRDPAFSVRTELVWRRRCGFNKRANRGPPAGPTPPARPSSALGQERFPLPHSVTAPPVIQSRPTHASTRRTRMHIQAHTHAHAHAPLTSESFPCPLSFRPLSGIHLARWTCAFKTPAGWTRLPPEPAHPGACGTRLPLPVPDSTRCRPRPGSRAQGASPASVTCGQQGCGRERSRLCPCPAARAPPVASMLHVACWCPRPARGR